MGVLAEEVPFSHHVNSTIVCRLSGKIMDEDNMPMAFPNGYVYSREVGLRYRKSLNRIELIFCPFPFCCRHWRIWQRRRMEWSPAHDRLQLATTLNCGKSSSHDMYRDILSLVIFFYLYFASRVR